MLKSIFNWFRVGKDRAATKPKLDRKKRKLKRRMTRASRRANRGK
jgi:hypothetical protein